LNREYEIFTKGNMRKKLLVCSLLGLTLTAYSQKKTYPPVPVDAELEKGKEQFMQDAPATRNGRAPKRPNVILIVADDLGRYDVSVYGNTLIETPNIDRLAREGALFTDGYATAAICSPSRAGLLTGRYQQRFGYHLQPHQRYPHNKAEWWFFKHLVNTGYLEPADFGPFPSKKGVLDAGLPQSEIALSELMKKQGYATAWIGKWHLGYSEPMLPKNFGFDYRYGCLEAYTLFADVKDPDVVNARINEFTDKVIWKGGRKGYCAIRENEKEIDEKEYLTYAFARRAKKFISEHKDEPFFIYLPFTAPHTPYQAPKDIYDKLGHIEGHNKRVYYAMVIALDLAVGDIMNHLKKEGLDDNTMVIFTSDNGAALYSETVTNKPLAGGKMTFFEGGINVPLIIYYKGIIKPGTVLNTQVNLCDVFATVAAVSNASLPEDRIYDGVSLLPWLTGARNDAPHEALYWMADYNLAIRMGSLKLMINTLDRTVDLYNLSTDRGETTDLSKADSQTVNLLETKLKTWAAQMPPMRWPRIMDYTLRVNGKVYRWAI
jgi:arylsulfatase A-like enzyme